MRPLAQRRVRRLAVVASLLASVTAVAQTGSGNARDELEKQLREMVGKPPTRVKVTFLGLDEPGYSVEEAVITLDGAPLSPPSGAVLSKEGEHLVFQGDYPPGDHRLDAKVTIADAGGVMFSYQNGFKWKIGVTRTFNLQPGLEVQVVLKPWRDAAATNTKEKFKFTSTATPKMLAVLDDGSMPEPMAKRPLPAEVDAGHPPTEAEKAAEARRLAAEEKKRKADEAAAAKLASAEEKKRLADEAKAAKLAAAEEKKRKAEEDKAARLAAAEEKRLRAAGKLPAVAAVANTGSGSGSTGAPVAAEPDAGPAEVDAGIPEEVIDAGLPPAAVARLEPKPEPKPVPESGMPWIPIAVGGALVLLILILLARRRANPKDPGA